MVTHDHGMGVPQWGPDHHSKNFLRRIFFLFQIFCMEKFGGGVISSLFFSKTLAKWRIFGWRSPNPPLWVRTCIPLKLTSQIHEKKSENLFGHPLKFISGYALLVTNEKIYTESMIQIYNMQTILSFAVGDNALKYDLYAALLKLFYTKSVTLLSNLITM